MAGPELILCLLLAVSDGDTVRCRTEVGVERVRVFGLNCPELRDPSGPEAKRALVNLLRGKIEIERKGRDRYGRTVAVVYANKRDVARRLIASGTCREACRFSRNAYAACATGTPQPRR